MNRPWWLVLLFLGVPAWGDNLAVQRIASSSAPATAQAAVDGRADTWWSSGVHGDQYLYVDLDATCRVNGVRVKWGPRPAKQSVVQFSDDAIHWRPGQRGMTRYVRLWLPRPGAAVDVAELVVDGVCDVPRPPTVGQTFGATRKPQPQPPRLQSDGRLMLNRGWQLIEAWNDIRPAASDFGMHPWYAATVPGSVLTSLVNDGVLPEPLYGLNNRRIEERYNQFDWWYREHFTLPSAWTGRRVWLNFDGINWKADVWLDGKNAGQIDGAFTRGRFDVTDVIHGGDNLLAVRIHHNKTPGVPLEQTQTAGTGPNGGKLGADNPTFHATVGWDWIPGIRDRSMGIWQPVWLSATGPAVIRDPQVVTEVPSLSEARLTVRTGVRNAGTEPWDGALRGTVGGLSVEMPVHLLAGETREVSFPPQTLDRPRLWWPNGYGPQNLYTLHLTLRGADGAPSDVSDTHFGVRQMSYDDHGHELVVMVNGKKILCKGGNWGMDEAMKRIPRARLEACIRMHALAHLTMIRNWIGMDTEEDFYDLCDRYGILVWNDFWLANPVDGPDPDDPAMFLANAADCIERYRNHPCIAPWCGRNEGDPPPRIQAGLQDLTTRLDGTRRYQTGSDRQGVHGHGPYCYQDPVRYFSKLAHGFTTEIGLPSVPSVDSLLSTMPRRDLWPINDTWAYHDFCHGAQNPHTYMAAMAARWGPANNIEDFTRKAQMLNYDDYRAIFEAWNRKLWHDCSGVLLWMSHPAWPSTVWQLYAYDLEPTAALYGVQKACEPIHVQLNLDDDTISVINNTFEDLHGLRATLDVYGLDGKKLTSVDTPLDAPADAATAAGHLPDGLPPVCFVQLILQQQGKVLSENFYWHAKDEHRLQVLNTLPTVKLTGMAYRQGSTTSVAIRNLTSHVALMIKLTLRDARTGRRILPAFASENYFSLLPGASKTVAIESAPSDHAVVRVEGWNIRPTTLSATR
ncbi:MAG TPA: discoidin domain-containing protein [Candidatus Xenobia bacterium]